MKSGKVVLGVLAGLAAGAALGILFAPDKGTNTRKKIGKKKDEMLDDVKEKFNAMVDSASAKLGLAKDAVVETAEKSKVKLDKATSNIKDAMAETLS
jgi:gas vesicle protein